MDNIPWYSGRAGYFNFEVLIRFLIRIGVWAMTAAAVLDVGSEEQSPKAQTLVYLTCYRVLGWTFT